jgi:hypothetical protein
MPDTTIPVPVILHIPVNPLDAKTPEEAQEFVKDILAAANGKLLIPIDGDGDGVEVDFTQPSE